jgi:hypothetical protein
MVSQAELATLLAGPPPCATLILSIGHEQLYFLMRKVCRDQETFQHLVKQLFLHVHCINKADNAGKKPFPFRPRLEAGFGVLARRGY